MRIRRRSTLKVGIVIGAVGMYLLDPEHGQERRSRLLERIVSAPRAIAEFANRMTSELDEARRLLVQARSRVEASLRSIAGDGSERPEGPGEERSGSHPQGSRPREEAALP